MKVLAAFAVCVLEWAVAIAELPAKWKAAIDADRDDPFEDVEDPLWVDDRLKVVV